MSPVGGTMFRAVYTTLNSFADLDCMSHPSAVRRRRVFLIAAHMKTGPWAAQGTLRRHHGVQLRLTRLVKTTPPLGRGIPPR